MESQRGAPLVPRRFLRGVPRRFLNLEEWTYVIGINPREREWIHLIGMNPRVINELSLMRGGATSMLMAVRAVMAKRAFHSSGAN